MAVRFRGSSLFFFLFIFYFFFFFFSFFFSLVFFFSVPAYLFDESKSSRGPCGRTSSSYMTSNPLSASSFSPGPSLQASSLFWDTGFRAKRYHLTGRLNLVKTASFVEQGYITSRMSRYCCPRFTAHR